MNLLNFLWVFIGGGLGSICRFGISLLVKSQTSEFPWATLWANIISCLILGFLVGVNTQNLWSNQAKLMLMTGFCGGFSTFSTFSNENFHLFNEGSPWMAVAYITISLLTGLLCIFFGLRIGQLVGS